MRGYNMEFKELAVERYSSRNYSDKKIDEGTIQLLKDIIRNSPSALNIQPWKIKIVSDNDLKEKLAPYIFGGKTQVPTCSHLLILCANADWDSHIKINLENMRKAKIPEENINYYLMALDGMFGQINNDQRVVESQKNVYLTAASAIFGAKSLGVDSCVIQGFNVEAISQALELTPELVPTLIITWGYAVDSVTPKDRLPEEEIFF
jgi:nitroreductase